MGTGIKRGDKSEEPEPVYARDRIELPRRRLNLTWLSGVAIGLLALGAAFFFAGSAAGWFGSDEAPPLVSIEIPREGAKYEGSITVTASVSDDDRISAVVILLDGVDYTPELDLKKKRRLLNFKLKLDTALLADGKHTLEVNAGDKKGNEGSAGVEFYTDNTPTVVELAFEPARVDQGRILQVWLSSNEKLYNLKGELWEQEFPFYEAAGEYLSIMTVRASCPPGEYPVAVRGIDANDEEVEFDGTVVVKDGGYITEYITISTGKQEELYDPAVEERKQREASKVRSAIMNWTDEQLWAGEFIVPVEGKFTSPFGTHRTFNTGATERHLGTDIAAKEGTPIRAGNRGKVVLAEHLIMRGKCVIIDHGRGVITCHNHMSDIVVGAGDIVEKGQVIGFIGSTGLATGSHLHWEMRVFRWVTDPMEWTENAYTYRTQEEEAAAAAEVEIAYEEMLAAPVPEWDPDRDLTVEVDDNENVEGSDETGSTADGQ
ncbi:MAG: peptidoglycan DD-metalloendopeptidase family protein [Candidatus Coatesbacteria bacterium]|nr:MAG: peptidoglycan DD-metalloendopeptidase family protein [Candidatus Coatesbacteria bacterium]